VDRLLKRVHATAGLEAATRNRVGMFVCMGMTESPLDDLAPAVVASRDVDGQFELGRYFAGAFRKLHPLWPLAVLQNVAIGQIAIDLDIRGDNVVLSSEGDAAVRSVTEAGYSLETAGADHVLVGGASHSVSAGHLARLRLRGDLGRGPAGPGSTGGDGCSPGEAAAVLLLEGPASTHPPRAFLRGGATTFERAEDRAGPTEDAFRRAIEGALAVAGCDASDVDAVFLHAEGKAAQDAAEIRAVARLTGDRPRLVATKGALGHTGGAAPVVDVALAMRALETGVLPPTVVRGPVLGEYGGRLIAEPTEGPLRCILVLAAGSPGGAGALMLEGAP
jgi:3-oxoacyl-(acyl-carrier-protein) synthase